VRYLLADPHGWFLTYKTTERYETKWREFEALIKNKQENWVEGRTYAQTSEQLVYYIRLALEHRTKTKLDLNSFNPEIQELIADYSQPPKNNFKGLKFLKNRSETNYGLFLQMTNFRLNNRITTRFLNSTLWKR
jgi:hypothetical protein